MCGSEGGLCLLWSDKVDIFLLSFSFFHTDVRVFFSGSNDWRFTGFYGNPEVDQRCHAWSLLRRLHGMAQLPWLCIGDFNEILCDEEKLSGVAQN